MAIRQYKGHPLKWQIDWYQHGDRRMKVFDGTYVEAVRLEAEIRKAAKPLPSINPRLNDVWPDYLHEYTMQRSPNTVRDLSHCWRHLQLSFGKSTITTITPSQFIEFLDGYRNAPRQGNKMVQYLVAYINWISERYGVERPAFKIPKLKYKRPVPTVPSHEDVQTLIAGIEDPLKRAAIIIMSRAGARRTETLNIRWENINWSQETVILRDKVKTRQRLIVLPSDAIKILKPMKQFAGYVFENPETGEPFKDFRTVMQTVCRKAGIQTISNHQLRHYFATSLLAQEGDLKLTSSALGHSSVQITQIYTQVSFERLKKAVRLLEG